MPAIASVSNSIDRVKTHIAGLKSFAAQWSSAPGDGRLIAGQALRLLDGILFDFEGFLVSSTGADEAKADWFIARIMSATQSVSGQMTDNEAAAVVDDLFLPPVVLSRLAENSEQNVLFFMMLTSDIFKKLKKTITLFALLKRLPASQSTQPLQSGDSPQGGIPAASTSRMSSGALMSTIIFAVVFIAAILVGIVLPMVQRRR